MKDFRFLNFYSVYSCHGSINKKLGAEVCFAYVFQRLKNNSKISYEFIIYRGTKLVSIGKSNACFMSRKQLKNHINVLRDLFPIRSTVREIKIKESGMEFDAFKVTLYISKVPAGCHKYALTWLRYTYEYPYNVILMDVYRLKQEPKFRFESISNIFNLAISCSPIHINGGHAIIYNNSGVFYKPLTRKELSNAVNEINHLNDIYSKIYCKYYSVFPEISKIRKISVTDLEYWIDDRLFIEERKPIYMSMLNRIKK